MNEWQYAGRVMSIVVIIVIYASIWVNILCQYNKPFPHDWCLENGYLGNFGYIAMLHV